MTTEYELENIESIKAAKRLMTEMKSEKEKYEKLHFLARKDWIDCIRSQSRYEPWLTYSKMAMDYLSDKMNGKKISKNDDNRIAFTALEDNKIEQLLGTKVDKIIEIYGGGYESCYYEIVFKSCDKEMLLCIPDCSKIYESNVSFAHDGMISIGERKGCLYDYFFSTYLIEELKPKMLEYLEREKEK